MGQSAGAMSIQTLICSDKLKGKVKGAIMLSGGGKRGAILPLSKSNTRYWKKVVKASGAKSFDEFKSMPTEQVWTTWKTKHAIGKALCTKPVIDGDLVKDAKYVTDVPIVFGTVKKDLLPPVLNHMARAYARKQKRKGVPCYVFSLTRLLPPDNAVLSFLRPLVCSRFASEIVEAVYGARLRLVRRDGGQICGVCKDEQSKRQGQTAMENVFFKVGYQSVRLKKRWLILRIKIV